MRILAFYLIRKKILKVVISVYDFKYICSSIPCTFYRLQYEKCGASPKNYFRLQVSFKVILLRGRGHFESTFYRKTWRSRTGKFLQYLLKIVSMTSSSRAKLVKPILFAFFLIPKYHLSRLRVKSTLSSLLQFRFTVLDFATVVAFRNSIVKFVVSLPLPGHNMTIFLGDWDAFQIHFGNIFCLEEWLSSCSYYWYKRKMYFTLV